MKKKNYLFQIIIWTLCAVVMALLIFLIRTDRTSERQFKEKLLREEEERNQQEIKRIEEERLKSEKAVQDAKAQIIERISQTQVPRIICWGDNEMAGETELTLPDMLASVTNENLYAELIEALVRHSLAEEIERPSIVMNNMGVTNEGMREILVRAGVNDLLLEDSVEIPSEIRPVNLSLKDDVSKEVLQFTDQKVARFGTVGIEDVEGTMIIGEGAYDEEHPRFAFVRNEEGDAFEAEADTEVSIESATKYLGDIPVFFFRSQTADSDDEFVSDLQNLVDRYTDSDDNDSVIPQYVVICTVEAGADLDQALVQEFGKRYIRNNTYANEMTEESYVELAQKVYESLYEQGCFDEVEDMVLDTMDIINSIHNSSQDEQSEEGSTSDTSQETE